MTDDQIRILESSFSEFTRRGLEGPALFYERLFALDPALRTLFAGTDMKRQAGKLVSALGLVVSSLRKFDEMRPILQALARRHVAYGVETRHYETVGKALLQTFALALGPRFTAEHRAAWSDAYAAIAGVMLAEAAEHEPQHIHA